MSTSLDDTVGESSGNKNISCFKGVLCSLVKPRTVEETRARYKGMFMCFLSFPGLVYSERALKEAAESVTRAETIAFDQEHEDALTSIEFRIQRHVEFGEALCLVGSVRALGDWDAVDRAIPMQWSQGDTWTATVSVRRSEVPKLEYKYIVKSEEGLVWEQGGNHNVLKPAQRTLVQEDFWEFPGYNCRVYWQIRLFPAGISHRVNDGVFHGILDESARL